MTKTGERAARSGALIVNADDWGRDRQTTDRIAACVRKGTVSAVSAMVFMEDSERAAKIACEEGIDTGLHLNFTTGYTGCGRSARLVEHQNRTASYLRRHALNRILYNPLLANSFEYQVLAQIDEFRRVMGREPGRLDGHHHMHLCANVLLQRLLPVGTVVRRNLSFLPGEQSVWNRAFRNAEDRWLARRHKITDFLYSLAPIAPAGRLDRIFSLTGQFTVEVETHPIVPDEYAFLMSDKMPKPTAAGDNSRVVVQPGESPICMDGGQRPAGLHRT